MGMVKGDAFVHHGLKRGVVNLPGRKSHLVQQALGDGDADNFGIGMVADHGAQSRVTRADDFDNPRVDVTILHLGLLS